MRFRSVLFLFVFLLSIASLAGAAPMSTSATDAASSPDDSFCELAKAGIVSALDPTLPPQEASTLYCGICSVTICRGAAYNSICQGGINIKRCIAAYGLDCPADGLPQCQCWSGPLP